MKRGGMIVLNDYDLPLAPEALLIARVLGGALLA